MQRVCGLERLRFEGLGVLRVWGFEGEAPGLARVPPLPPPAVGAGADLQPHGREPRLHRFSGLGFRI